MTKEQFLHKWAAMIVDRDRMQPDLNAVIANEIEKSKPALPMTYKEAVNLIISNRLTHKWAGNDSWFACGYCGKTIQFCDENGNGMIEVKFDELDLTEWYPYTKPFDQDRFEAMFRAVVASGRTDNEFIETEEILEQLDAYCASKKGGNNG